MKNSKGEMSSFVVSMIVSIAILSFFTFVLCSLSAAGEKGGLENTKTLPEKTDVVSSYLMKR